jgi:hypothetical protein
MDPAQRLAKRNIEAEAARRVALGPGSRARTDTVRKIDAEARLAGTREGRREDAPRRTLGRD